MAELTQKQLKELLHYDPETGLFTWVRRPNGRVPVGSQAGSPNEEGYIRISVKGYRTTAHRLAWLFMTGGWPKGEIDHINRNKADNRFENLRDVPKSLNQYNRNQKPTPSGVRGVCRRGDKYLAYIGANTHLGTYESLDEAIEARKKAEVDLGVHPYVN
jgi:hypothetical protein